MKKLVAAASALALTAGLAFAETHETLKAHTLSTSVGDISFGAWGRSTFNVGRQMTKTKIDVDVTSAAALTAANSYKTQEAAFDTLVQGVNSGDATAAATWAALVENANKTKKEEDKKYNNDVLQPVVVGKEYTKNVDKVDGDKTYIGSVTQVYTENDKINAVATYTALMQAQSIGTTLQSSFTDATTKYATSGFTDASGLAALASQISIDATKVTTAAQVAAKMQMAGKDPTKAEDVTAAVVAGTITAAEAATANEVATAMTNYAVSNGTAYGQAMGLITMLKKFEKDENNSKGFASLEPDWSYGSRVGFWIIGRTPDQKYGFDFNLDADAHALFVHKLWDADEASDNVNYNEDGKYAVAIGDQAKIWGLFDTPFGLQNKVAFGKMREQELRGTIGDFGQRESGDVKSEDDIFSEFWPTTGLFVSTKGQEDSVLEGFYAAAAIDLSAPMGIATKDVNTGVVTSRTESAVDKNSGKSIGFYDAMRTMQAGIGYTVPGLVQVKAQYWGDSISEWNYRYARNTYKAARKAGFDMNDYYGRMEFGIDWLGFMGGATSFLDPNLNLSETPNANLIELGFKLPIVTDNDLRDYDPEKFYNWYSCLGTMGVVKQGFIMYKGHVWGGQGVSNLAQYTDITGSGEGLLQMKKGDGANIFMAGVDFLTEVCINPFGKQDVFVGLSGNYNITSAKADGKAISMDNELTLNDLKLRQHNIGAEIYIKKTFAANNFMFAGIADRFSLQTMDGNVNNIVDLSYKSQNHKIYMPIGIEMFF